MAHMNGKGDILKCDSKNLARKMSGLMKKMAGSTLMLLFLASSLAMGGVLAPVTAAAPVQILTTNNTTMIYAPTMPVWNPFSASNFMASSGDMPMAIYSFYTNAFIPVLASSWEEFPSNGTLIVHLRKGLSWYNGSATLPFTAMDVYTEFYIGAKAFGWYAPVISPSGIRVLNNYTIEFVMHPWTPSYVVDLLDTQISTPYSVWRPYLESLTAMNATQASLYATNITHFVQPPWFSGPTYTTISVPYLYIHLDPPSLLATWDSIFPYHTWQYYNPTMGVVDNSGGNGQSFNLALAGEANALWVGLSPAQDKILAGMGWYISQLPQYGSWWEVWFNEKDYPVNVSQVREALAYAVNLTHAVATWDEPGYELYFAPTWYSQLTTPPPAWLAPVTPKLTLNVSKAAALLESVGFYEKNGQWYMPNGQPFKLTLLIPGGWTDIDAMSSNIASQWTSFGIPTTVLAVDAGTLYGATIPDHDYEVTIDGISTAFSIGTYALQAGGGPGWFLAGQGWNLSRNYPITFPNGTKVQLNFTKWEYTVVTSPVYSAAYNESIYEFQVFLDDYWPGFMPFANSIVGQLNAKAFNLTWVTKLSPASQALLCRGGPSPTWVNGDNFLYWPYFGVTPYGVPSPVAQAMATKTLSPEWAEFLGIPLNYTANYASAALSTAKLSLSAAPTSITQGGSTAMTASVTYPSGSAASRVAVNFLSDGKEVGSAVTGTNARQPSLIPLPPPAPTPSPPT